MYRAVLFDLDGVLTADKTGSQSTIRSLARHTGLPEETLRVAYYRHNRALLYGGTTHEKVWPDICREVGQPLPFDLLHTAFAETPMDDAVLRIAWDMKAAGYLVGLVTDNKVDRVEAILDCHGLWSLFDAVSISAAVGSGKGDRAIFEDVLRKLEEAAGEEISPAGCIFVDNSPQNLTVPARMGMAVHHFDDERRDAAALRAILLGMRP